MRRLIWFTSVEDHLLEYAAFWGAISISHFSSSFERKVYLFCLTCLYPFCLFYKIIYSKFISSARLHDMRIISWISFDNNFGYRSFIYFKVNKYFTSSVLWNGICYDIWGKIRNKSMTVCLIPSFHVLLKAFAIKL